MPAPDGGCRVSCESLGAECGTVPDGCGTLQNCGVCLEGHTCGGGGAPNKCVAPARSAAIASDLPRHPNAVAFDTQDVFFTVRGELGLLDPPPMSVYEAPDSRFVRVARGGAVYRAPLAGGAPVELATGKWFALGLARSATDVFFLAGASAPTDPLHFDSATLYRVPKAGGAAPVVVAADVSLYSGVAVDGAHVYFVTDKPMRAPVDASSAPSALVARSCAGGASPSTQTASTSRAEVRARAVRTAQS